MNMLLKLDKTVLIIMMSQNALSPRRISPLRIISYKSLTLNKSVGFVFRSNDELSQNLSMNCLKTRVGELSCRRVFVPDCDDEIADIWIFELSLIIVDRFWAVPKQRNIPSLDAGFHFISLLHSMRPGACSLLSELRSS